MLRGMIHLSKINNLKLEKENCKEHTVPNSCLKGK